MTDVHQFEHEAMKTSFIIRINGSEPDLARKASSAAFERLDELEQMLSRYIHGSDVWQINHMRKGDRLLISDDCYQCLRLGLQANINTGGLFDPTLGTRIEHFKSKQTGKAPEIQGQLMIDPERPAIHCIEAGREIDLGGIGKGYALDRIAENLLEWGIDSALVSSGASTHLALGPIPWEIELTGQQCTESIQLQNQALSASGTGIQGAHIVNPDVTASTPLQHSRIWILHSNAALADAWSTAALLTEPAEIMSFDTRPNAIVYEDSDGFRRINSPPG